MTPMIGLYHDVQIFTDFFACNLLAIEIDTGGSQPSKG